MVIDMSHVLDIKPRVIAAEIKSPLHHSTPDRVKILSKPHIAGELDLVGETTSEPHYVEVRDGALLLYPGRSPRGPALWRLPLRRLNLQPASSGRPRGFSLSRHGQSVPLATFQVGSDAEYERWVKTLAAELMRQTPLDAVRFLDILGITATLSSPHSSPMPLRRTHSADSVHLETSPSSSWTATTCPAIQEEDMPSSMIPRSTQSLQRQRKISKAPVPLRRRLILDSAKNPKTSDSFESLNSNILHSRLSDCTDGHGKNKSQTILQDGLYCTDYTKNSENSLTNSKSINNNWETAPLPDVVRDLPPCERRSRARNRGDKSRKMRGLSAEPLISSLSDDTVAKLMARCQQDDQYVPVRDKRLLFETLCRRRFVCSTDNISISTVEPRSLARQLRAQSLHDLSDCHSVAVKDMCKYFEQRDPPTYNLIHKKRTLSDSRQIHKIDSRLIRNRQNVTLSEEALWRLQEQAFRIRVSSVN